MNFVTLYWPEELRWLKTVLTVSAGHHSDSGCVLSTTIRAGVVSYSSRVCRLQSPLKPVPWLGGCHHLSHWTHPHIAGEGRGHNYPERMCKLSSTMWDKYTLYMYTALKSRLSVPEVCVGDNKLFTGNCLPTSCENPSGILRKISPASSTGIFLSPVLGNFTNNCLSLHSSDSWWWRRETVSLSGSSHPFFCSEFPLWNVLINKNRHSPA